VTRDGKIAFDQHRLREVTKMTVMILLPVVLEPLPSRSLIAAIDQQGIEELVVDASGLHVSSWQLNKPNPLSQP
jgi:hypothetical protein